jgi:hypothetical protein
MLGTGAGDGSVSLFDLRTGGSIVRLPLSSSWEVRKTYGQCYDVVFFFVSCSTLPSWCCEVLCSELDNVWIS